MSSVRRATAILLIGFAVVMLRTDGRAQQATPPAQANPPATPGAAASPQRPPAGQTPPAGQAPAGQTPPTFRGGINFVSVDVIVTEKGQPVTNLAESDFEVREDGRPQSIEQFRVVKVDGTQRPGDPPLREIRSRDDEELEASRDDVRVIVFFLDDYHTRLASSLSVKQPLIDFIQKQVRPGDLLGVMYPLTPVTDVTLTRNHASVIAAINAFEGRKYRYIPRNQFEERYSQSSAESVELIRNQVVMGALRGLATRLGSVRQGRKSVVFVSEGLTASLPPQLRTQNAELGSGLPNQVPVNAGDGNAREETAAAFSLANLYQSMKEVYTMANRNNTSFYALDPRGLATNEFSIEEGVGPQLDRLNLRSSQEILKSLSEETDGRAIVGRNDLARGLGAIIQDSSAYYLIGYSSAAAPADGKFHEIKVTVKRKGLDVRARRGYWAATAEDVSRVESRREAAAGPGKAVETALASIAAPVRSTEAVRTWIGTSRGDAGRTRVTLVWEPVPIRAGERRETVGRLSVLAATAEGSVVFRGRSAPEAAPAGGAVPAPAGAAAGPVRISFDAPPGPLELRLSAEGAAGGVVDSEIRKFTVPDFSSPAIAVSTPRIFRARNARDVQQIARDDAALPVTGRDFSRAERLLVKFDTYAPASPPALSAVLLNRTGQKMADVPITPAAAGGTHQIDLGLATIPPGEYLVEITAGAGSDATKTLVAFRVVS